MGVVSPPVDLGARIAPWETLTLRDACAVATAGTNDGSALCMGMQRCKRSPLLVAHES
ncbi:hypothetical protein XFF6166_840004 [Xanthomonas citri pv. fuscans]|nr:hypothetical protein XFF6166_840004 [Xanthomonas citri pv. fuscans]SOO12813.1 hypothetical protein XFF7766_1140004 [Xanthomonas citri pv. fuscans]